MLGYYKFTANCLKSFMMQKASIVNNNESLHFADMFLYISLVDLKSDNDKIIGEVLGFLEVLAGQKASILKGEYVYRGTTRIYLVTLGVKLRNRAVDFFFEYCVNIGFPVYLRKFGYIPIKRNLDRSLTINLEDPTIFFNLRSGDTKSTLSFSLRTTFSDPKLFRDFLKLVGWPIF